MIGHIEPAPKARQGRPLRENCRPGDLACRVEGEAFAAVPPATLLRAARNWGERLCGRVRRMAVETDAQPLRRVTVSVGLAVCPDDCRDWLAVSSQAEVVG